MAVYPGATFKPTPWGGKVPRNRQGRGMLHVAVSERTSYPPNSGVTWHFYIAKAAPNGSTDGSGGPAYCEQYVDTEYRAYGGAEGNDDQLIVETAGGMGSSAQLNAEPWTRAQVLRIADLMRWEASQPGGAPLELLPDAKPGRRGWGPHRLGIKHSAGLVPGWWFPGCELWSNALGKECPGNAKVAQVPGVIALAKNGTAPQEDDMAQDPELVRKIEFIYDRLNGTSPTRWYVLNKNGAAEVVPANTPGAKPAKMLDSLDGNLLVQNIAGLQAAVSSLADAVASGRDDLTADELRQAVTQAIQDAGMALRAVEQAATVSAKPATPAS